MNTSQDDLQGAPLTLGCVPLLLRRGGDVMNIVAGKLAFRRRGSLNFDLVFFVFFLDQ